MFAIEPNSDLGIHSPDTPSENGTAVGSVQCNSNPGGYSTLWPIDMADHPIDIGMYFTPPPGAAAPGSLLAWIGGA